MRARLALRRRLMSIAVTSVMLDMAVARHPAHAQSAEAEALFNDGVKLLGEGKVAQACAAFFASNRVEPRAGTLIRLGDCLERNQQLASAWSAYKDALIRVKDPRKRQVAMAKAAALEPRLSQLTVVISDDSRVEGLIVTRNGEPFDPVLWNRPLPVDGGDYIIAGRAPGREDWQTTVHVATEGARVSANVPRLSAPSKPAPQQPPSPMSSGNHRASIRTPDRAIPQGHDVPPRPPEPAAQAPQAVSPPGAMKIDPPSRTSIGDRRWAAWKPWAVVGAGATVVAVGGVLDVLAARDFDAFDSGFLKLPCANTGCLRQTLDPHLTGLLSRARREQQIAVGGYIVGGAAIAAGAVLLYLNRPHRIERDDANPGAAAAIIPVVSRDTLGVVVMVSH